MGLYSFNGSKNATIDKSPHSMRALSFIIYRCKGGDRDYRVDRGS